MPIRSGPNKSRTTSDCFRPLATTSTVVLPGAATASTISCRRQHSPTVALVDQGPGSPSQAARVLASLRAAPLTPKSYCFASSRTFIRDRGAQRMSRT